MGKKGNLASSRFLFSGQLSVAPTVKPYKFPLQSLYLSNCGTEFLVTPELITRWTIVACRNKAEVMVAMSPSLFLAGHADPRRQEDLVHLMVPPHPNCRSSNKLRTKVWPLYTVWRSIMKRSLQARFLVFWRLVTLAIFINVVRRMKTSLKFLRPGSPVRYKRVEGYWWLVHADFGVKPFTQGVTMPRHHKQKSRSEFFCRVTYKKGVYIRL